VVKGCPNSAGAETKTNLYLEKTMKICVMMYPWEQLNPETDSTLRLIHEAVVRKHTVAITTPNKLTIRGSTTRAFCQVFKKQEKVSSNIPSFYKKVEFKKVLLPLAGFDAIIMRSEPPLDNIAINFLDSVKEDTFIMNDINGLRIANNKLYTSSLDDDVHKFVPVTHVSKSMDYLEKVLIESDTERMIMKPLNGFGGKGIIVIEKNARQNFRSLLEFYNNDYVILQEYIEGADQGDVRIMMLNGHPIGAMRRIPADNEVRSNVHAGGTVVKHTLTKKEKELCHFIGPKLVRDGLYFAGIDVINGKLIEVNVLSPGGISRINKLNRTNLQKQVIDFVESVVNTKELIAHRKNEFRKAIDDADTI